MQKLIERKSVMKNKVDITSYIEKYDAMQWQRLWNGEIEGQHLGKNSINLYPLLESIHVETVSEIKLRLSVMLYLFISCGMSQNVGVKHWDFSIFSVQDIQFLSSVIYKIRDR